MRSLILAFLAALNLSSAYLPGPLQFLLAVIAGFFLPGLLVSRWLPKSLNFTDRSLYAVLISLTLTFAEALITNLVALAFASPIADWVPNAVSSAVILALTVAVGSRPKLRKLNWPRFQLKKVAYVVFVALLPFASVASAFRFNTQNDSVWSAILTATIVVLMAVFILVPRIWNPSITIFSASLSLVLLSSARGDFLSGIDMSKEYYLFRAVEEQGFWSTAISGDAYNSSLSINVLPNFLAQLLQIDGASVFRFMIPAIYALVPVIIMRFFTQHGSRLIGAVGVILFISQPAYVVWSPVPTRQMVAIVFFSAILLVAFDKRFTTLWRDWLTLSFGIFMVLSHYSTAYLSIPVLAVGTVFALLAKNKISLVDSKFYFYDFDAKPWPMVLTRVSALKFSSKEQPGFGRTVTPLIRWRVLIALSVFAFMWFGPITHVSDNLATSLSRSVSEVTSGQWNLFGANGYAKGTSLGYQLGLSSNGPNPDELFHKYTFAASDRLNTSVEALESQTSTNTPGVLKIERSQPDQTAYGKTLLLLESLLKNLLRVFLVFGYAYSIFRFLRRRLDLVSCYALAAGLALVTVVVMPGASIDYDVGRTTQQMLPLLGLVILSGPVGLTRLLITRVSHRSEFLMPLTGLLLVGLLAFSTGLVNRVTGATSPNLMLSSSGEAYDQIYVHSEELAAAEWVKAHAAPGAVIQAGYFGGTRFQIVGVARPEYRDVFAWTVDRNGFLLRDYQELQSGQALVYYAGNFMRYVYPSYEIEKQKGTVYSNGGAVVYK